MLSLTEQGKQPAGRTSARRTAVLLALVAVAFYFGIMLIMAAR